MKYNGDSYWYLASPYSHDLNDIMQRRYESVMTVLAKLINSGWPTYCPVVHWHNVAVNHSMPRGYEFWYQLDRLFLGKAVGLIVLMLDGWKESVGVTDEIKIAKSLRLPIFYINE